DENVYGRVREEKTIVLIVVTSNRGLCGAFNASVIKRTLNLITTKYANQAAAGNVKLITIGKKATAFFSRRSYPVIASYDELYSHLDFEHVIPAAEFVMDLFAKGEIDKAGFIYNQFKTAASQVVTEEQFLPIVPSSHDGNHHDGNRHDKSSSIDYIFEPSKE